MSTLLLWLEAPLQSWGVDSRFGRRDTLPFPSRSGILGLLCAASGRGGEQTDWLAHMAGYAQTVVAYARKEKDLPRRLPLLCDFQMVGSGYNDSDPWQNMLIPKKSDGKKPVGSGTKMTYRYAVQDMAFACALEVPAEDVEVLTRDLCAPVWDICLGRRSCIPTDFIYKGTFLDEQSALTAAAEIAVAKERIELFRVLDGPQAEVGEVITLNDVPLSFGVRKRYRDRQVTVKE